MQSQLLRELSPECTPRNTFGHRHEPYRLSLRKVRDTVNAAITRSSFSYFGTMIFSETRNRWGEIVLVLVLVLRPRWYDLASTDEENERETRLLNRSSRRKAKHPSSFAGFCGLLFRPQDPSLFTNEDENEGRGSSEDPRAISTGAGRHPLRHVQHRRGFSTEVETVTSAQPRGNQHEN